VSSAQSHSPAPLIVQMHGGPGTGKSTLARLLGEQLPAIIIEMDLITQALSNQGIEGDKIFATYYAAQNLAGSMVDQGYSTIIDGPAYREGVVEHSRRISTQRGARWAMIECVCDNEAVLRTRLAQRSALPLQAREPVLLPPSLISAGRHLVLDTVRPLDECAAQALSWLRAEGG